jgi:hypothetical protein
MAVRVGLPLDDDGFLRCACSNCEREFKCLQNASDEEEPEPDGGYFCPYYHQQGKDWFTEGQHHWMMAQVSKELSQSISKGFGGSSNSGLIRYEVDQKLAKTEKPLEVNDMQRVDFLCHPKEPVKVLDGWAQPVHCMICGEPS